VDWAEFVTCSRNKDLDAFVLDVGFATGQQEDHMVVVRRDSNRASCNVAPQEV
jgi:hypothetical protein